MSGGGDAGDTGETAEPTVQGRIAELERRRAEALAMGGAGQDRHATTSRAG